MKEFRKTENGLFICEECGKVLTKSKRSIFIHIKIYHNKNFKEYYDKWRKENNEGICKYCGKETRYFNRWDRGYALFCNKTCKKEYGMPEEAKEKMKISFKKTCNKRYGADNVFQVKEIKEKCEHAHLQNFGVKNVFQSEKIKEKIKQTNLERYGVEYSLQSKEIKEKGKQTCLEKYGVENPFQYEKTKEKYKQTCLEKWGVENPQQNKEIHRKGQQTRLEIHQFQNTNLWYQGSYELDFLEKYYDKFLDIQRGSSINYVFNNENKVYHTDFYIPLLNLIVEIKSSWTYDPIINPIKQKATIANGFNYIMIIDKDYSEFNKLYIKEKI